MKKWGRFLLMVVALVFVAGAANVWLLIRHGVSARDEPTALEALVARRLRHLATPQGARAAKNPVPLTPEILADARAHFADHCASCHDNDGRGQTEIGRNLYPKAPDMTLPNTQSLPDGELFYIIRNGIRLTGMPAWGTGKPEDDQESWKLVHLIRHFPKITSEEVEEMKALNPKSPDEWAQEAEIHSFLEREEAPVAPKPHDHSKHRH